MKKKILIAGAGGAPSEGVINSLLISEKKEEIIGMGSEPTDLALSQAVRKYFVPYADSPTYKEELIKILRLEKPDLIHFQNDLEIFYASQFRDEIHAEGVKTFMPHHDVIDTCVHKYKTWQKLNAAGVKVPCNILLNDEYDLKRAFAELGDQQGKIWLRASSIGAGGKGALPTNDFEFAKHWISHFNGWGDFCAAQMLTSKTVTWLSIWNEGELVVAQTRIRKGWVHGNRTLSGVTGVTKVGQTYSDPLVDQIAIQTIKVVSEKPHGIFGVDMTYDADGIPNPTEINISRFFTTVLFFTKAGLNLPSIYKDIVLYNKFPQLEKKVNPLPDGLLWLRGMDTAPRLMKPGEIENGNSEYFMILVTGASGFIGKHLLTALVMKYGKENVVALTSIPTPQCAYLLHHNYNFHTDYLLKAGYDSIDTIIHVGAFIPKSASEGNDWEESFGNIYTTNRILNLQLPELRMFVYLSSVDVYGKDEIISEQSLIEPVSLYGHSKLFCEKMISSWAKKHGKIFHVLRVGHIYGPGEEKYQKLIPITIQKILTGQTLEIWGEGNEVRSFLYIDDLVRAILQSIRIEVNMDVVNLVSGNAITVRALIDKLVQISGFDIAIKNVETKTERRNLIFDNSVMKKWMNVCETPLDKGLSLEWEYMKTLQA